MPAGALTHGPPQVYVDGKLVGEASSVEFFPPEVEEYQTFQGSTVQSVVGRDPRREPAFVRQVEYDAARRQARIDTTTGSVTINDEAIEKTAGEFTRGLGELLGKKLDFVQKAANTRELPRQMEGSLKVQSVDKEWIADVARKFDFYDDVASPLELLDREVEEVCRGARGAGIMNTAVAPF